MATNRGEIRRKLESIPQKGRLLFAVLICERLHTNYEAFEREKGWGNSNVLRKGISAIKDSLIMNGSFEHHEITELIQEVDNITPSTESFPGILTSFALDACTSILSTLNYLIDKDIENLIDVATYARDTVDMFIQERDDLNPSDPALEEKIASDSFMIREIDWQNRLFDKLIVIRLDSISDKMIEDLRDNRPIIDLDLLRK